MSAWWREWAAAHGVSADARQRAELCLNEAVANVILHHSRGRAPNTIEVIVEAAADDVEMTVVDDGDPFDPVAHEPGHAASSLDDLPVGGLGIPLMRRFADTIRYRHADGGNRLTFTFVSARAGVR